MVLVVVGAGREMEEEPVHLWAKWGEGWWLEVAHRTSRRPLVVSSLW